jgi:hypothetical protein
VRESSPRIASRRNHDDTSCFQNQPPPLHQAHRHGFAVAPIAQTFLAESAAAAEMVSETNAQAQALGYKADATKAPNRTDP